jgi:hypothetical protein
MEMSGQLLAQAVLPPGKEALAPIEYEAGWAAEPGLDAVVKRKNSSPCRDSNSDHPARSAALYH